MDKRIDYKNIEKLKEAGNPVIIFKVVREAEAIKNACHQYAQRSGKTLQ